MMGPFGEPNGPPLAVASGSRPSGRCQSGVTRNHFIANIDRFVQQPPNRGAPATERTEVRILYDDDNLYVAADLLYEDPSNIVRTGLLRDANTAQGDAFAISLDTFHDRGTGAVFFINAGGALRDAQTSDDGRVRNLPWNSAGEVKTHAHDRGWSLELRIPWSSLRFEGNREEQVWGMHLF